MKKLSVDLENCYGIQELHTQFDFSENTVYAIYAPNGAMKSSLAETFKDVADDVPSKDRVFPARVCSRRIVDENGDDVPKGSVLVVRTYDESFGHTEKTSTLLVDAKLRTEYEQLHVDIDKAKAALLKALKAQSSTRKDVESELSSTFTKSGDQFEVALNRVKSELLAQTDAPFADIRYDRVFDDKVVALLGKEDVKTAIADYVTKYNELLAASTYFKRGTFNYYNASTIARSLADNGFFAAKHSVRLNADESLEITSVGQLEDLIAKEKEGISNDADLRKKFAELGKLMEKNNNVREFQAYLEERDDILPKLVNIEGFREEVWKSYLKACIDLYLDVIEKYAVAEKRKKEIEDEAREQQTLWEQVINIFNSRFYVPFTLIAKNRTSVILGEESMLVLGFVFTDRDETAEVDKKSLMAVLSSGERKALYILNVIFEIEARKKAEQDTIFVIDDIADSFDYRNKYAIIQYLKEIAQEPNFSQVLLTHNFDFFRTVHSRFVPYYHCLMAFRNDKGVLTLRQAEGIKNIFVNDWKGNFFKDPRKRFASIPFIRNLIEYTKGEDDAAYVKLTSVLHWKAGSAAVSEADLDALFRDVFGDQGSWADGTTSVIDDVMVEATACLTADDGSNFENKIVLSIAVRIAAEQFMIEKIGDPEFVKTITTNQSAQLFEKYRGLPSAEDHAVEVIESVMLMTPENIHLNSFMYEPILDMSDEHLRKLYGEVLKLKGGTPQLQAC